MVGCMRALAVRLAGWVLALACLGIAGVVHAQVADTPVAVRRIADSGAVSLALDYVDRTQPKQWSAANWVEWESLRLELLARQGREPEIVTRAKSYSTAFASHPAFADLATRAARAALSSGEPALGRRWLGQVFLAAGGRSEPGAGEYRSARMVVIEAFLAEGRADAAYRSMLRFQQDFSPLRPEELERFVAGLIGLERFAEAAGWLAQLDAQSPYANVLRMRAGLLAPAAAIVQARAQIGKGMVAGWTLLEAAGRMQSDRSIAIEVSEHRLNGSTGTAGGSGAPGGASAVWTLYAEAAPQVANQAQLLTGDDAAWLAYAHRILATRPQSARALLGHLAVSSAVPKLRADARIRLLASLRESKLQRAALALFDDVRMRPLDALEPGLRYELGALAADSGRAEAAVQYWRGLAAPDGMSAVDWALRNIRAFVHAGMPEEALARVSGRLDPKQPLPDDSRAQLSSIATDANLRSQYRLAEQLLTLLLAHSPDAARPAVLIALGKSYEGQGEARAAAAAFLQAASTMTTPESREALQAREAAAQALLRAGLRDDARALYERLARDAKDQGVRESAARALRAL